MGDLGASLFFPCSLFDVTPEIFYCFYPKINVHIIYGQDKRHILMSIVT